MAKRKPSKSMTRKAAKHGFSHLHKDDDLIELFCGNKSSSRDQKEDFAALIEESLPEEIYKTIDRGEALNRVKQSALAHPGEPVD